MATTATQPPRSWRPGERQSFLKVAGLKDPDVQAVVGAAVRREAQINDWVEKNRPLQEYMNQFARVIEPHQGLLSMLNAHPLQAVDSLMRTAAVLYQGSPQMQAQAVAKLISDRKIDPAMVADYLDGVEVQGAAAADPRVDQALQRVSQLEQGLKSAQQARAQEDQRRATAKVETWGKTKPFFQDVRDRMSSLMVVADAEGRELTLDDAYDIACSMDPEVKKLVAQQKKAEQVRNARASTAADRRAASSPRPNPTVRARGTPTGDRHADVAEAWEQAEGRIAS